MQSNLLAPILKYEIRKFADVKLPDLLKKSDFSNKFIVDRLILSYLINVFLTHYENNCDISFGWSTISSYV